MDAHGAEQDALVHLQGVLHAVIEFAHEQSLCFRRLDTLGDIECRNDEMRNPAVFGGNGANGNVIDGLAEFGFRGADIEPSLLAGLCPDDGDLQGIRCPLHQ